MSVHIDDKHLNDPLPDGFQEEYEITKDERIHQKLEKGQVSRQPAKKGTKRKNDGSGEQSKAKRVRK